jgi:S-adenosyl methyltransferase
VALMLLGILHDVSDTEQAYSIVRRLMAALVSGSFVVINHSTSAVHGTAMEEAVAHWNQVGTPPMTLRTPQQIARLFDGLELLPPGVVSCSHWGPDLTPRGGQPAEVGEFCGVARKAPATTKTSPPA